MQNRIRTTINLNDLSIKNLNDLMQQYKHYSIKQINNNVCLMFEKGF